MRLARLLRHRSLEPHLCPVCGGDFVCPVEWQEADAARMWVRLRCGQCGAWREGEFTDEVLDSFDRRLDEVSVRMAREADKLHRDWRSKEADAFAAALERDLIDAGDFT